MSANHLTSSMVRNMETQIAIYKKMLEQTFRLFEHTHVTGMDVSCEACRLKSKIYYLVMQNLPPTPVNRTPKSFSESHNDYIEAMKARRKVTKKKVSTNVTKV